MNKKSMCRTLQREINNLRSALIYHQTAVGQLSGANGFAIELGLVK
ncbi:MAG: hypothetical protein HC934_01295 [Acaryochloridaceae cyanobacterium SU_2_1]|nr:hypothetical protein [Acaryochloridaceae cyanobacterium SU_2_1]